MDPARARALLDRRKAKAPPPFDVEKVLFAEQLAFIRDPARFATAVCSVRAGKSVACAVDLVDTATKNPNTIGLYITLTRSHAKRIVWPELLRLNRQHSLGAKPNIVDLSMTFPNGSVIYCGGANTAEEIEKYRGLSNVVVAYVDEGQSMRKHIQELVEDVLTKRLYDTNGRCRIIGTPGPIPSGYFYQVSQNPKWAHHGWTLHQNMHIQRKSGKTVEELIQQDCDQRGVTVDHPSIQRECFGRWEPDESSLILHYDPARNHYDSLPNRQWSYVMGIDVGFVDADAVVVLAYSDDDQDTYLVHEDVVAKQDLTSLVHTVERLQKQYGVARTVIDEGGLGKKLAEEMRKRWGISVEPAEKTRKFENLALLNDAIRRGNLKAKRDSRFAADCMELELDREKSRPDKMVVSNKFHSDVVDAVLYAFKLSPAYSWTPKSREPVKGSREWYEKHSRIDWDAERERLVQSEVGDSPVWPTGGDWGQS